MRLLGLALYFTIGIAYSQTQVPENNSIKLNGEWYLTLDKFLSAGEIKTHESVKVDVPGVWNGVEWKGATFSGQGFGTYYRKIQLASSTDDMAIYMPSVGLAYRILVNDFVIGSVGVPDTTSFGTQPKIKPTIFRIPNRFRGQEVVLAIHVANFSHQNGGVWFSPEIGNSDYLRDTKLQNNTITLLVLGSIFIIMFYHFFLFVLRPKEKYSLNFALICLCLIVHASSQGEVPITHLFPDIGWDIVMKMGYSSLFLIGPLNLLFVYSLYPNLIPKVLTKNFMILSSVFAFFVVLVSPATSYYLVLPFQILTLAIGVYLFFILVIAARRELNGARILLVGFSFTLLGALNDVLNSQFIIESVPTIHFGVFIYVLTLSMVLAKKFVRSINSNERLKFELGELNEELEHRVINRTTELHSQKELVKEKNKKLQGANEELNQLMAVLAHDLKSPLLNINSLSQMMKNEVTDSAQNSNHLIQKIAVDGISMIDNLISLKRLEKEDLETSKKPFDLSRLLEVKVAEFTPQATCKNQSLVYEIPRGIELNSSERHISQVIENLLSNSIKFSNTKSEIKLNLIGSPYEITISVKDNGPGFSERDKKNVFKKFHRLSAKPTAGESSSGLGLSIVKMLVEKLDGEITLNSNEGEGSEFIITLPLN